MKTTMKISQVAWDHLWETSTGCQTKMFDDVGNRPEPNIQAANAALRELMKNSPLSLKVEWNGVRWGGPAMITSKKS